jgi:hypothetical protein
MLEPGVEHNCIAILQVQGQAELRQSKVST